MRIALQPRALEQGGGLCDGGQESGVGAGRDVDFCKFGDHGLPRIDK